MENRTPRKGLFRKKIIFWFVFIVLLLTGLYIILQEYRATTQSAALIKDLKNRSLKYALQLQKGNEITEHFPIIAATGNLVETHFLSLQNRLQITVKNVDPALCQKIIRSGYQDPVEIIVNNDQINRKSDSCPRTNPVEMTFYYDVPGRSMDSNQFVEISHAENMIGTALETATQPQEQQMNATLKQNNIAVMAPVPQPAPQPAPQPVPEVAPTPAPTVQSAPQSRSPLRRFSRRKVLPGETLGDVVSADSKKRNLASKLITISNQPFAALSQPVIVVSPMASLPGNQVQSRSKPGESIDEILAQDAAQKKNLQPAPQSPVSLQLDTYPAQNDAPGLEQFLEPDIPVNAGVRDQQTQNYQRLMYDDSAVSRTGLNLIH